MSDKLNNLLMNISLGITYSDELSADEKSLLAKEFGKDYAKELGIREGKRPVKKKEKGHGRHR